MLGDKRVSFVCVLDSNNRSYKDLSRRVMHHQETVTRLIKESNCLVGRKTQEMSGWKGKGLWVLTRDKKWRRNQVNVTHSLDDARLHIPGEELHVLGGISLFKQLERHVDEFLMWNIHKSDGNEDWIDLNMSVWAPVGYRSQENWAYAKLERIRK
jgi:dihydrofolate reductase